MLDACLCVSSGGAVCWDDVRRAELESDVCACLHLG